MVSGRAQKANPHAPSEQSHQYETTQPSENPLDGCGAWL